MTTRALSEHQAAAFDVEYAFAERWDVATARITDHFGVRPFTFLDVGGGNGLWADRLLEAFPAAHAVVLEPSDLLLQRNVAHRRKRLVRGTAATLPDECFDLICVHWLLHHLVGNSYRATVRAQIETLRRLGQHLTSTGRIGVFENMYTGSLWHDMPGRLIYAATSLRSLAPLTRRLGANTAGVGVAFHSRRAWEAIIAAAELQIDAYAEPDPRAWPLRRAWRVGLTLRSIRVGHFWLRA